MQKCRLILKRYIIIFISKMSNNRSYSPEHMYIGVGDDVKKIQGQSPSAVKNPPPPKPSK